MKAIKVTKRIEYSYPTDKTCMYCIPSDIIFKSGFLYSILGVSGSGKSTILTLLAGLRRFDKGEISYSLTDSNIVQIHENNWKQQTGPKFWGNIGFSFQRPELIRALSVKENLFLLNKTNDIEKMALKLFDQKEWDEIKDKKIWKVSGGQIQRLGLIRAFAGQQNLIFMDEPTNNLDKSNRTRVAKFVQEYRKDKIIIFVSHDRPFMEILKIKNGFGIKEQFKNNQKMRVLLPIKKV